MTAPWKRRVVIGDCTLYEGDCLEVMPTLGKVDAVIADPPYGTTACKWDEIIPIHDMWAAVSGAVISGGAVVLMASQPFSSRLVMSNLKNFAHEWVWNKRFAGNFLQAARQPLKTHELVLVFSTNGKQPSYYPQKTKRDKPISRGGNKPSAAIPIRGQSAGKPFKKAYDTKHPTTCESLLFSVRDSARGAHPTLKPVDLMAYLVRTYSLAGDCVLDFTMGSGTTGVACVREGRRFVGVEMDPDYFDTAVNRITNAYEQLDMMEP